jgi:hypothetical protein
MSNQPVSVLERFRQPEYTGENRCLPCTIVNVAIAFVMSAFIALVALPLGAVVFVASLLAIYLRGYLVPGTPTLTKQYLPNRILSLFDTHPIEETKNDEETWQTVQSLEYERAHAVDPEQFLLDIGAVGPCEHEDDLCLTDEFARRLDGQRDSNSEGSTDSEKIAGLFDTEPDSLTVLDREYPAVKIDRRVRKWPSEAALLADFAADRSLRAQTERWLGVPLTQRLGILKSLRSFYERCPRCSGEIYLSEETTESCCRSYEVIAIGCRECEQPLLEFNPSDLELRGDETGVQP